MNDPQNLQALWSAFPIGYFPVPGTVTVGGQQVLRGRDQQPMWFDPQEVQFYRNGSQAFDHARNLLHLLPDLDDEMTYIAVLRHLAMRCGIDPSKGLAFVPKSAMVRNVKRNSVSKQIAGWTVRTLSQSATFPVTDTNERLALLECLRMSNCTCGQSYKSLCPQHGKPSDRPWS
jgi:hypothetical protein